ncbi:AraC family transcriptional regulator [Blautia sp. SG-772]|nr:AraC family transcriptional regulator [Blautia sp. SG-772]
MTADGNTYFSPFTIPPVSDYTYGTDFYHFVTVSIVAVSYFRLCNCSVAAVNDGFCDEFHLSKAFKKHFGLSPSQYRQLHG